MFIKGLSVTTHDMSCSSNMFEKTKDCKLLRGEQQGTRTKKMMRSPMRRPEEEEKGKEQEDEEEGKGRGTKRKLTMKVRREEKEMKRMKKTKRRICAQATKSVHRLQCHPLRY